MTLSAPQVLTDVPHYFAGEVKKAAGCSHTSKDISLLWNDGPLTETQYLFLGLSPPALWGDSLLAVQSIKNISSATSKSSLLEHRFDS